MMTAPGETLVHKLLSLPSERETRAAISHSLGKRAALIPDLKPGATGGKR